MVRITCQRQPIGVRPGFGGFRNHWGPYTSRGIRFAGLLVCLTWGKPA